MKDEEPQGTAIGSDDDAYEVVAVQWDGVEWIKRDGVLTRRTPPKEAA